MGGITTALLIAVMVFLYSLQSLFCKLFSESYESGDAALTSTIFSITYGLFAGLATLIIARFHFVPSGSTWLYGLLNALMLLIYNTSMIQASRTGSYSFQMISALFGGILVPMIYGALFLSKSLTWVQLLAIAMMLVSFVLMNLKGLSLKGNSPKFLLWCGALFLSNGLYSVHMNLQATAMSGAERNEMIILTFLGMAVVYAAAQLVRGGGAALVQGYRMKKKPLVYLLLCSAVATAAVHLALLTLTLVSNETVLFTIDNGGVLVLSVLYSFILFHERPTKPQLCGIALATVSIVMLSL